MIITAIKESQAKMSTSSMERLPLVSFDFRYVPYDVLQWELSPFLNSGDRANFNAVLDPTERVHKRFPKDFAEKHAVRMAHEAQKNHVTLINYWVLLARDAPEDSWTEYAIQGAYAAGKYADFFTKPVAAPLFKYRSNKNNVSQAVRELTNLMGDDTIQADFMTHEIRTKILRAIAIVKSMVPEKHVPLN